MKEKRKYRKGSDKLKRGEILNELLAVKISEEESDNINPPRKKETRKRWSGPPTDHEKELVRSYAAFGASDIDIACVLNMAESTLQNHFSAELMEGRVKSKAKIGEKLYNIAVGYEYVEEEVDEKGTVHFVKKKCAPNLTALIFLAKVRLGWKETQVIENLTKKSQTVLYLPDNSTSDFQGEYGNDPNSKT